MRRARWTMLVTAAAAGVVALAGPSGAQEKQDGGEPTAAWSVLRTGSGAWLGVYIREVGPEDVERLDLPEERGALVERVLEEGPAAEASLEDDDVIHAWNGERVESAAELRRLLREIPAGREARLGVWRDGGGRTVTVELGERPETRALLRAMPGADFGGRLERNLERLRERELEVRERGATPGLYRFFSGGRMGIGVQSLGEQLGEYFGLGDREGVLVTSVREDSPAAAAGLRAGDVILAAGEEEVSDPGDLVRVVMRAEAGPMAVRILRERTERTLEVELPEAEDGPQGRAFYFGPGDDGERMFRPLGPGSEALRIRFAPDLRMELQPLLESLRELRLEPLEVPGPLFGPADRPDAGEPVRTPARPEGPAAAAA